jgi:hypothetical protein
VWQDFGNTDGAVKGGIYSKTNRNYRRKENTDEQENKKPNRGTKQKEND